jgi:hypothetical protein
MLAVQLGVMSVGSVHMHTSGAVHAPSKHPCVHCAAHTHRRQRTHYKPRIRTCASQVHVSAKASVAVTLAFVIAESSAVALQRTHGAARHARVGHVRHTVGTLTQLDAGVVEARRWQQAIEHALLQRLRYTRATREINRVAAVAHADARSVDVEARAAQAAVELHARIRRRHARRLVSQHCHRGIACAETVDAR